MSNSSIGNRIVYLKQINTDMNNYFVIVALLVGLPGNLFSAFIFARLIARHNKTKNNMGLLYATLCLIDFTSIAWILLVDKGYLTAYFGVSFASLGHSFCPLSTFMRRACLHFSSWMAVLITFDRYLFVFHPSRLKRLRNRKLGLVGIIAAMLSLITLADIPNFYFYRSVSTGVCTAVFGIVLSSDVISIVIRTYVPITLIVFFDLKMIFKIWKKNKLPTSSTTSATLHLTKSWTSPPPPPLSSTKTNRLARERLFTMAVISSGLIFSITHFPISGVYIAYDIKLYSGALSSDPLVSIVYSLLLNAAANFSIFDQVFSILNYWTFNKIYRQEVARFFGLCLCCCCFQSGRVVMSLDISKSGKTNPNEKKENARPNS